jgi:hypothetical protein
MYLVRIVHRTNVLYLVPLRAALQVVTLRPCSHAAQTTGSVQPSAAVGIQHFAGILSSNNPHTYASFGTFAENLRKYIRLRIRNPEPD